MQLLMEKNFYGSVQTFFELIYMNWCQLVMRCTNAWNSRGRREENTNMRVQSNEITPEKLEF